MLYNITMMMSNLLHSIKLKSNGYFWKYINAKREIFFQKVNSIPQKENLEEKENIEINFQQNSIQLNFKYWIHLMELLFKSDIFLSFHQNN